MKTGSKMPGMGNPENPFETERCFYAGVPLINPEGLAMGTLFGMSSNPQDPPSAEQARTTGWAFPNGYRENSSSG